MQPHLNCNSLICGPLQSFAKIRSRMLHKLHCTDYIFCLLIWTTPTNNFCRNREDHLELPSQKYTGLFLLIVKCLYKILWWVASALEKSSQLINSNIHINYRKTVPLILCIVGQIVNVNADFLFPCRKSWALREKNYTEAYLYDVYFTELGTRNFFPGSPIAKLLICFHGSLSLKGYFSKFPGLLTAKLLLKNSGLLL